MTRDKCVSAIVGMATTFGRELPALALDGYWHALRDLDEQQLGRATARALREHKYMPSAAALRELAGAAAPSVEVGAMIAWQAVRSAIDRHDYLVASIDFGPLVNAVIRNLGGWDTMCRATLTELDNPGWLRKRFDEVYQAFACVPADRLHGDPLDGALPAKYVGGAHVLVPVD